MTSVQTAPEEDRDVLDALRAWNDAGTQEAAASILPCNGSRAWAAAMAARRPIQRPDALFIAADVVWSAMGESDRQEAFDSHPRIGEQQAKLATNRSLQWSEGEQSAAAPDEAARVALAEGNIAYEKRFGRIFLVCATGKSAAEMLKILQQRLGNDAEAERCIAGEEQRKITQLRLRKWLGGDTGSEAAKGMR